MISHEVKTKHLIVSPSPHIHCGEKTSYVMYSILIALVPAIIFAISQFGFHAIRVMSLAIASAMAAEWIIQILFKRPVTVSDGSALVTGLLFAMIIPPSTPWWLVVLGSILTIFVGKQIFGGIGCHPFNPVLIGWAILSISWKDYLNFDIAVINYNLDYSIAYPLSVLKKIGASGLTQFNTSDLILGSKIGGLGSVSVLLLLIGGLFLIIRGVVSFWIPLSFIIGIIITSGIFWLSNSIQYASPLFHIISGNVMIGAFFLATENSSSPVNRIPMILYGIGCGVLTIIFRVWSIYPDGVVFAILIMNIINPLVDKITPQIPEKVKQKVFV
ncbi:MAG: RnfABCDGE type electron transport complex subunit D [Spirochaetota bacterium]|nr:RnfABCDGE type electron transport complex subunit D [Spirochaetota bacterium]